MLYLCVFSSPNPLSSSFNRHVPHFSFTSFAPFTPTSSTSHFITTQSLPTFSTPSKHRAHSNARNSNPLTRLLHDSLDTPEVGCQPLSNRPFAHPYFFRSNEPTVAPLTAFPATLAASLQPIEIPAALSPFAAILTSRVNHNSCVCHSCKKHRGLGPRLFLSLPLRPFTSLFPIPAIPLELLPSPCPPTLQSLLLRVGSSRFPFALV